MPPRIVVLTLVSVGAVSVLTFAVSRAVTTTSTPVTAKQAARPPRPALTSAEEAYMRAASKKDFEKGETAEVVKTVPAPLRGIQRA